jgi:putative aldouronate transport system permease protein
MADTTRARTPLERIESLIIGSALILMVVVTLQPLLNLLAVSLSDPAKVAGMNGLTIFPNGFSPVVWKLLITHPSVLRGIVNSAIITIGGTLLNVIFTALMAWGFARRQLPGRRVLFVMVLVTIVFDPGIIPDYFVNKQLGLLNTYWSVMFYRLVDAWYLIILVRFFEAIPEDLLEAASLDGANAFQAFWHVALPLARPALATITLFYFVFHWNEFFRAMIYLNDQNLWPLQVVLRQFVVEGDKLAMVGVTNSNNYTDAAQINVRSLDAGMVLLTIVPILAIYPLILKFFTKGALAGALKG